MKYIFYVLIFLAIASMVFNSFKLDFDDLLVGDSQIAVISIIAAFCVIVLMCILLISYKIKEKSENYSRS